MVKNLVILLLVILRTLLLHQVSYCASGREGMWESGGADTLSLNPGKRGLWAVIWILKPYGLFFFLGGLSLNLLNGALCGVQSPSGNFRKDSTRMLLLGTEHWFLCLPFRSPVTVPIAVYELHHFSYTAKYLGIQHLQLFWVPQQHVAYWKCGRDSANVRAGKVLIRDKACSIISCLLSTHCSLFRRRYHSSLS